jgi:hypothetical protein
VHVPIVSAGPCVLALGALKDTAGNRLLATHAVLLLTITIDNVDHE